MEGTGDAGSMMLDEVDDGPVGPGLVGRLRRHEEGVWRWSTRLVAVLPLAGLLFVLCVLAVKAWPAVKVNGAGFLTGSTWNPGSTYGAVTTVDGVKTPVGAHYGAWPLIAGTLQTSAIALCLALPISIGAASR